MNNVGRKKKVDDYAEYGYTKEEWESFHKSKRWRIRNPGKQIAANKRWVENNRQYNTDRQRKYWLRDSYGMTEEDYNKMLEEQKDRCAICDTSVKTGRWKRLCVDHCHTTGKVRGLLCNECNRGMGLLKDNADILRKAATYLDERND